MRGAWGKPQGTVARVNIGQILISVRTKDSNKEVVTEALRRCKFKFPGRQKIIVSKKWGFTRLSRDEYVSAKESGRVVPDGAYAKFLTQHGPISDLVKRLKEN